MTRPMEKALPFYFPPLTVEDKVQLRRHIRAQRAQSLNDTLAKLKTPEFSSKLGERVPQVVSFLGEVISLSRQNQDLFWQVLDHWSMPFILSRVLLDPEGPDDPEHLDHLVSNLSNILLFERLQGDTTVSTPATYITHTDHRGMIHGLLQDLSLEFRDESFRGRKVEWFCSGGEVSARLAGSEQPAFTLRLPVSDNQFFKFVPLTSMESVNFPILDETTVYGKPLTRFIGAYDNPSKEVAEWTPLTLQESLGKAQELIGRLWPEALEWAVTLVPAFVDMGKPPGRIRFSSSYESGSPIFMSRVDDYLIHAEDLVHEIQHHRLYLVAGTSAFKCWRRLENHYVSPYRPDPRPLRGLILGVHAFLTVNELKKRLVEQGEASEAMIRQMVDVHYKNLFSFRTLLEYEEFGDDGRELFREMGRVLAEHHSLITSAATAEMLDAGDRQISKHVAMVEKQSTELKNAVPIFRNWDETARLAASFN